MVNADSVESFRVIMPSRTNVPSILTVVVLPVRSSSYVTAVYVTDEPTPSPANLKEQYLHTMNIL
jgi:hypothetical protein